MHSSERKAIFSLASIFAFRMLGLFMILPVFALYAHTLPNTNATLIGLALGIYGLTQACLQIPFGMLSDKIGRKPMIIIGMCIFALGSIIAAQSDTIVGIILGRAIQGAGAVGSVIIALVADLTLEQNRTKAMAIIGLTIGSAFILAMILGPILNTWIGIPGIFWLTAILALLSIVIITLIVPTPSKLQVQRDAQAIPQLFSKILCNPELLRLNFAIFCLHGILTAIFIAIPVMLQNMAKLPEQKQWMIYLPTLILAFIFMVPFIIIAEKKRKMKSILIGAICTLFLVSIAFLSLPHKTWIIASCLLVFFTAFTLLEASLPSLISKIAPAGSKGTAMGIYSPSQFLGIFVGGTVGGWLYGHHSINGVFIFCAISATMWLLVAIGMKQPPYLATFMVNIGKLDRLYAQQLEQQFLQQPGVAEAFVNPDDGIAYLKIDSRVADKQQLVTLA
jgi:MFS family permease